MSIILLQFIIIFLHAYYCNSLQTKNDDQQLWEMARKSLAQRTREYIKDHPISEDLQSFIDEINHSKREKRQGNMYAIKNGDVVPLEQLEEQFNTESNLGPGFTVVPLLIPIPLQNTVTLKNRDTTENNDNDDPALWRQKGNHMKHYLSANKDDDDKQAVVNNLVEDKLKATSSDPSVDLSKVLADVQNLISAQKKSNSMEGALCNVSGFWNSQSGGKRFHIKRSPDEVKITMRSTEPPTEDGFIKNAWNISAEIPFAQAAQVIIRLTAHKGKKVALFLGECRVCDGSETITGDWLVSRISNNCKDQKAAHSFISDVFRKDNTETLKKAHLKVLASLTAHPTTSTELNDNF
ncbi:unnamed protein product [Ceutorhynchus assimilis]|uniref:Uncharacterized protein n=1 Tax=Ceutorhynchus assimilis TaxID=467358 RepID=A0A9N9QK18_9CUCU|nr:unnamed protein product [Ceutorhynchus assimilis]